MRPMHTSCKMDHSCGSAACAAACVGAVWTVMQPCRPIPPCSVLRLDCSASRQVRQRVCAHRCMLNAVCSAFIYCHNPLPLHPGMVACSPAVHATPTERALPLFGCITPQCRSELPPCVCCPCRPAARPCWTRLAGRARRAPLRWMPRQSKSRRVSRPAPIRQATL